MEQQLIDVLDNAEHPDDIDDISKDMITARVMNALEQVSEVTFKYLKEIEKLQKMYAMELKLGGFSLVLNATNDIVKMKHKKPTQTCVLGSKSNVMDSITQILEVIHG